MKTRSDLIIAGTRARAAVVLVALGCAGFSTHAEAAPCGGPFRWATANSFGSAAGIPGVTTDDAITGGQPISASVGQNLSQLGDRLWSLALYSSYPYGNPATLKEVGACFHIEQDPANPDGTSVFEVRALVRHANLGAKLAVKIRRVPLSNTGDVNTDMPEVPAAGAIWLFNPQPTDREFGWAVANVDLGPAASLATGDYFFCLAYQPPVGPTATWYFDYAAEMQFPRGGFQTPRGDGVGDSTYTTSAPDPLIVIRACDPTPTNHPPVAVASITGPVAGQHDFQTGTTVSFDGSESTDPDGTALSYAWTFGGEGTSNVASPSHKFDTAGDHTVTLMVSDGWYNVPVQLALRIKDSPPPQITALKVERQDGIDRWTAIGAVHVGDDSTVLRLNATVTASDGGDCTQCAFQWSWDGQVCSEDGLPKGTASELSLPVLDATEHELELKVTDHEPIHPQSAVRKLRFRVGALPTISFLDDGGKWGGPLMSDFDYQLEVNARVRVGGVALKGAGRLELTDLSGLPLPQETAVQLDSIFGSGLAADTEYSVPGLVRHGHYEWDPDHCEVPIESLQTFAVENFDVKAVGLEDANGFALPAIRSITPAANRRVDLDPTKSDHYREAYSLWCVAIAAQVEAISLSAASAVAAATGLGAPLAGVLAVEALAAETTALVAFQNHDIECGFAHDPIVPDPAFQIPAGWPPPEQELRHEAFADPTMSNFVWFGESVDTARRAQVAYAGSLNKLAGLYEGLPPVDPAWRGFAVQRGTDVIRNGRILADALLQTDRMWTQSVAGLGLTAETFAEARQAVSPDGLPPLLAWHLQELGADPAQVATSFLGADDAAVLAAWNAGPSSVFTERADAVLNQSFFAAPAGLVLVGITQPLAGASVNGEITIDARVVHKKEAYDDCLCGKTVVTEVRVDGHLVAQVPLPLPDCPVPQPALAAVPFAYLTTGLAEGAHTITVTAQDACPPVPPDEVRHRNSDTITILVDRTLPIVNIVSPDVDPAQPGIQVHSGDEIAWQAVDPGGVLVGPAAGSLPTLQGHYRQPITVADAAGNVASTEVEVIPDPDSDLNGNGIPDGWDELHLVGVDPAGDADPDHDGATNRAEWVAGTDPQQGASVFRVVITSGNEPGLTFLSRRASGPGYTDWQRFYAIESTADLAKPVWTEDPEFHDIPGLDQTIRFAPLPTEPKRFFRVRVELREAIPNRNP